MPKPNLAQINTSSTLQAAKQPWPSPSSPFVLTQESAEPRFPIPNLICPSQPTGSKDRTRDAQGMEKSPQLWFGGSFPQSAHPRRGCTRVAWDLCRGRAAIQSLPCTISGPWERGPRPSVWLHQLTKPQNPLTSTHLVLYSPTKQPGTAAGTQPCPQQHRMGEPACNIAWDTRAREDQHLPWPGASPYP